MFRIQILIFLLLFVIPVSVLDAQIFICTDANGQRHYSDKRCPDKKTNLLSEYNKYGKAEAPEHVSIYTSVLAVAKRNFALLTTYESRNNVYHGLYEEVSRTEVYHLRFMANPVPSRFSGYNPLGRDLENQVIGQLSQACRIKGYLTVCAGIEGNSWLSDKEALYLRFADKAIRLNSDTFCEKAIDAHSGGVISDKMMNYFCGKDGR